jgi:polysaccharide biosynthesis/export protein
MPKVIVRIKWCRVLLGYSLLLPLLYACSTPPPGPLLTATPPGEEELPSPDYIIGAEDAVEVQVWKNPDLSKTVTVRPDGKISLPLIGDIPAAGQTAAQLAEAVTEKLMTYYKEPAQVAVIVTQINSYAIYLLGEVHTQGRYAVKPGTTILQAISLAGGLTSFASPNKMTLRRRGPEGKESLLVIRYKDVLAGHQANFSLKPGDTIIVPRSAL